MGNLAIRVENLAKQYQIGAAQPRYYTLRDQIVQAARQLVRPERREQANNMVWALRDVSFDVLQGEVLGIIGRNGAGKSTLLKILSRITEPTRGRALIYGRVGSLLEVGTGFHPELTGRENITLNGAILGMSKAEITRKFDEIVDFAGIEKFIDTPVKRYSSGMYVRLAFAVAAHLEPEILLVDEVLAVGDAEFQKKCLGKMGEVAKGGRTVLFVSHNMAAVRNICRSALILDGGELVDIGEVNPVTDLYLAGLSHAETSAVETGSFVLHDVRVTSSNGAVIKTFDSVEICVTITAKTNISDPGLYVGVLTLQDYRVTGLDYRDFLTAPSIQAGQRGTLGFRIKSLPLLPGEYQLEIHLKDMASHNIEFVPVSPRFEVVETPIYGGRKLDRWFGSVGLNAEAIPYTSLPDEPLPRRTPRGT